MPFTLSHPVAVAPLRALFGRRVPLAAWVIGAMIPDVAYFVALRPTGALGHTLWGVLLQGLPAGLGCYLLWVWVMRDALRWSMPEWIVLRLHTPQPTSRSMWRWVGVCVGIIGGALTHLGWDSFTHATGVGVALFPMLVRSYRGLELYRWLQYGGGVMGGAGVMVWMAWALMRSEASASVEHARRFGRPWAWALMGVISVVMMGVAVWPVWTGSFHVKLVRAVIGACTGLGVGMVTYGVIWRLLPCTTDRPSG